MITSNYGHSNSNTFFSKSGLWQIDNFIYGSIMEHVNNVGLLLHRSSIKAPLVIVHTRYSQHLSLLMYVRFHNNFLSTVRTDSSNIHHMTSMPLFIIKLTSDVGTRSQKIFGVHNILVVIVNLNKSWPVLYLHFNDR